jgi:hypothetical protein
MTLRKADKKGRPESVAELSNQFCLLLPIFATAFILQLSLELVSKPD